ncbi:hypothetical protein [Ruegeria sp. EL01]|nr:hypothetical protein [Ruegeria sp. EL01]
MKIVALFLTLAVLIACEPSSSPRPEPAAEPRKSGISVSGYGRIGVSTEL